VAFLATLVAFLAIDSVWILGVASPLYEASMPELVRDPPSLLPAAAFYLLFVAALVHFAVRPGLSAGSVRGAAGQGGFLGLTAYATYALTNLSVIEGFAVEAALADLVWGGVLGAAVAAAATAGLLRWGSRGD
jgi:uncharacterized membrane protein